MSAASVGAYIGSLFTIFRALKAWSVVHVGGASFSYEHFFENELKEDHLKLLVSMVS